MEWIRSGMEYRNNLPFSLSFTSAKLPVSACLAFQHACGIPFLFTESESNKQECYATTRVDDSAHSLHSAAVVVRAAALEFFFPLWQRACPIVSCWVVNSTYSAGALLCTLLFV